MKLPIVKQTALDRAIAWIDPQRAAKRLRARAMLAMVGGYTGASKSRRSMSAWSTLDSDADAAIIPDLPTLRERSGDLIRNNPLAAGAINTTAGNVIGTGLRVKPQIDAQYLGMDEEQADAWEADTEREWRLWAESTDCDLTRTQNIYGMQELAFITAWARGDAFVLLPEVEGRPGPYRLAVQLVEGDRVCNRDNARDTETLIGGVQKDAFGAPMAYHVLRQHPGHLRYARGKLAWDVVPAYGQETGRRNMLHLFRRRRPGQTRGVPELAPVIELLKQLGRYTDGEVDAAVISSFFTVFIKSEYGDGPLGSMGPTGETGGKATDEDYKLASGAMIGLAPGESVETANPGRPNQSFDPFVMAVLRQIGVALELPIELLVQHFMSSYSAARASLLQAWKFFLGRRAWMVAQFCQPIYETWLTEAVATGRVQAHGFFADAAIRAAYCGTEWRGPSAGQIDPLKEGDANALAEDRGWKTSAEITAETTGGDWNRKHRQRAREVQMRRDAGLEPQIQRADDQIYPSDEDDDA